MNKMVIFDPAMCCSTGVCGPSVDENLLRVSVVINRLKKKDILIERHNLTDNPKIFVDNKEINQLINNEGIDILPITTVDGKVVKTKEYPTNEEFCKFLDVPKEYVVSGRRSSIRKNRCSGEDGCC
ncbi:arsenite efflux transporter metallochaperone ArsD [Tissierella creatinophila]|uniref:Arsenical resistance operon trans-acting repressor ArsD n=1 Tax=Tissierella creatinophila DSM 6911 TaxID=1123403 RepID=A0A1U7M3U4_TISCR|nr:arsenite efflux transporter metallochaperone ArsD [Tissierella creatinophila]OLS01987.1 arsenical resistance operon trans-acting repressor ArsD [Tissierella creatinophila DSM 6911]